MTYDQVLDSTSMHHCEMVQIDILNLKATHTGSDFKVEGDFVFVKLIRSNANIFNVTSSTM